MKLNSIDNKAIPLSLLFVRPEGEGSGFLAQCRDKGICCHELPSLERCPIQSREQIAETVLTFPDKTPLIFVSPYVIDYLAPLFKMHPRFQDVDCICLGQGSARKLLALEVNKNRIILPLSAPFNSENLLKHPYFSRLKPEQFFGLFRGSQGRDYLETSLSDRNHIVQSLYLYYYVSHPALQDRPRVEQAINQTNLSLISSAYGLDYLLDALNTLGLQDALLSLYKRPLIVPSARLHAFAKSRGFRYIIETGSLETQVLIHVLERL